MNGLEQQLSEFFRTKLPAMSSGAKETTVKVLPWVIIVLGILGILAWLQVLKMYFGFSAFMHAMGLGNDLLVWFHLLLAPITSGLAVYGGFLMNNRRLAGWRLVFYSLLLGVLVHILNFSILGLIIDFACAYLLFQTQEYYS